MAVAAAILAGGLGRRLGHVDKALLEVGGQTILERQLAVLAPLVDELLLVAGDPTPYAQFGIPLVRDRSPGRGPLGGLEAALSATRAESLLIFACDLPFLDGNLVRLVRDHAPSATAVVPRWSGRPQPLHARYARMILTHVQEQLARDKLRLLDLIEQLEVVYLEEPALRAADPSLRGLTNVNTLQDLSLARSFADR